MSCLNCANWELNAESPFCDSCFQESLKQINPRVFLYDPVSKLKCYILCNYDTSLAKFVKTTKKQPFSNISPRAESFVEKILSHWKTEIAHIDFDIICPVPGNPWRTLVESDFAQLFAQKIGAHSAKPVKCLLKRIWIQGFRPATSQKSLRKKERIAHMQSSPFYLSSPQRLKRPCRVLLVDDVRATGQSLAACASVLRRAGYSVDSSLVFSGAKTMLKSESWISQKAR